VGTAGDRAVARLRHVARRVFGPLAAKRSGNFYIWSRAVLVRVERFALRVSTRTVRAVSIGELTARSPRATYRELEPPAGDVALPPGWRGPPARASARRLPGVPARGQGVFEVPGGVVFGAWGSFGPDDRTVFADACSLWPPAEAEILHEAEAARGAGVEDLDGVTIPLSVGPMNYGHMLLQSVPRLALLRRGFGLEADRYLLADPALPVTVEALEFLAVPMDRVERVPARGMSARRCEVLRTATVLPFDEIAVPWAVDFLHELFLPDRPRAGSRRLYLRRGVARRAVVNEDDVLALVERAGFEIVTAIGMTTREQAALMATAEVVVAAHGSALANLVFCRPGTVVIDLMPTNMRSDEFALMATRLGLDYHLIMGTEPTPPDRWWKWLQDPDIVADVPALRRGLEGLGRR
jgi:hypothetical protein